MEEEESQIIDLFDFETPKKCNYVVMDIINIIDSKILYIIKVPDDYEIEIGNLNCEISIPEASIGKQHGTLKYNIKADELIYKDNDSFEHSQILIQRPIKLKLRQPILVLNGNSLICLELKKEKHSFMDKICCFKSNLYNELRDL